MAKLPVTILGLLSEKWINYACLILLGKKEALDKHLRISNHEARAITGISDTLKMSRLFKMWVSNGLLNKVGERAKKGVYYVKPGQEFPPLLFSGGGENK